VKKLQKLVENPDEVILSLEEVAKHNKAEDCWTVWKGKVFDITSYVKKHPGGKKILAGAGKDCTKLYNKFHPYVNALYLIGNLQVGVLRKEDQIKKYGDTLTVD